MDLDSLVKQFQKKDQLAFEQLYEMYWANICGVVNTIVNNRGEAEEITQDVFIKIWDRADSYNPSKGRFFTWVVNIARNAAIDKLRSRAHKKQKLNLPITNFVSILEQAEENEPEKVYPNLKKYLKKLSEKCVNLIQLLYFSGYSQKDASASLSIPLGTVKSRIRNCLLQLRKNMA